MGETRRVLCYASGIARHALPRFSGSGVPVRVPTRFQQPSIMPQRAFQPTFTRCMGRSSSSYEPKTTDEADELVDENLRKMTKLVSGDSGGGEVKRWPKDPWKVKRQNYTRHVLNLTKKGKASIIAHVITRQHQSLLCFFFFLNLKFLLCGSAGRSCRGI